MTTSYFIYTGNRNPKPHSSRTVTRYGRGSYHSILMNGASTSRASLAYASINSLVVGSFYGSTGTRLLAGGMIQAQNKALDKLYSTLNQNSDLVVAFKERERALDMVTSSLRTLIRTTKAVIRRDPKIVRAFLKKHPDKKDIIKSPSGLWLGYHFGVVPTIHDIHSALGIFAMNFPTKPFSVSSGASGSYNPWSNEDFEYRNYDCTVKLGALVSAQDPNVSLATALGFGQPLSVAWELTPFSWAVDYFANVGQMLTNLEPRFPGLQFAGRYTTRRVSSYTCFYRIRSWGPEGYREMITGKAFCRTPGWPSYNLEFSSPLDLKNQQCSYLAAVLGQLLTGMKPRK